MEDGEFYSVTPEDHQIDICIKPILKNNTFEFCKGFLTCLEHNDKLIITKE
jgi:hypothetical protein